MSAWETLWAFHTPNFTVSLDATHDDDLDLSWDDTGEVREKLQDGTWEAFCFRVMVQGPNAERLGADYLGGSIYADPMEFRREHIGAQGQWGSYFRDMISNAVRETRRELTTLQAIPVRAQA